MPRRGRRFFWFFLFFWIWVGFFRCSGFVGLSLLSCRSISVAPVRGGTYFLCCCKESRQRRQLKPQTFKRVPWLGRSSGASGIRAPAHSPFVTKPSSLPLRTTCVADGSARETNGLARAAGAVGCASAMRRNNRWFLKGFRRAQRRRKNDRLVTGAECAGARIPDAPLPYADRGTRLRAGGFSCLLCLLSLQQQRK
ncbi:hypothetical protein OKW37_003538 [Paraburkholderia sp. MM5482-R2]